MYGQGKVPCSLGKEQPFCRKLFKKSCQLRRAELGKQAGKFRELDSGATGKIDGPGGPAQPVMQGRLAGQFLADKQQIARIPVGKRREQMGRAAPCLMKPLPVSNFFDHRLPEPALVRPIPAIVVEQQGQAGQELRREELAIVGMLDHGADAVIREKIPQRSKG